MRIRGILGFCLLILALAILLSLPATVEEIESVGQLSPLMDLSHNLMGWLPLSVDLFILSSLLMSVELIFGFHRNTWYTFLDFWEQLTRWKRILCIVGAVFLGLVNVHDMVQLALVQMSLVSEAEVYRQNMAQFLPRALVYFPFSLLNLVVGVGLVLFMSLLRRREHSEVTAIMEPTGNTYGSGGDTRTLRFDPEDFKLLKKAEKLIEKGKLVKAAGLFDKLGKDFHYRAGKLYAQKGFQEKANASFLQAGNYFLKRANYTRAGDSFYFGGYWDKAADAYARFVPPKSFLEDKELKAELVRHWGEALIHLGKFEEAANLYLRHELFKLAAECFEKAGLPTDAAHAYSQAGAFEASFRALEDGGLNELAQLERGKFLMQRGDYAEAALEFEKVKHYEYAAEAYVKESLPGKAARCYMLADKPHKAAELFLASGEELQALQCYELMEDFDKAAQLAAHMGLQDKQAQYYEKGGYLLPAARAYLTIYETTNAVRCLEHIEIVDDATASACAQILHDLLDEGRDKEALACAYGLMEGKKSRRVLAPLMYALARIHERGGKLEKACQFYFRVANLVPDNDDYVGAARRIAHKLGRGFEPRSERDSMRSAPPNKAPDELKNFAPQLTSGKHANLAGREPPESCNNAPPPPDDAETTLTIDDQTVFDLTAEGQLSRYQVIKEVGRGGMGYVYKALDKKLNRPVALKMLHAENNNEPRVVLFFQREAKTIASLNHPNLVGLYDLGKERGCFYMVMEYVNGLTLKKLVTKYPQYVRRNLRNIWLEACAGVRYAHENGIIHRDLKPSNIMFTKDRRIKILDFGLAKDIADISHTRQVWGTPSFMAPELFQGQRASFATDIYGLGATFYSVATRKEPFNSNAMGAKFEGDGLPIPPHKVDPRISPELSQLILRCMHLDPSKRFQNVKELGAALKKLK